MEEKKMMEKARWHIAKPRIYTNMATWKETRSAAQAMKWHRAGNDVLMQKYYQSQGGGLLPLGHMVIHGAPAAPRTDENRKHCRQIAEDLEAYTRGDVYRCPECGEEYRLPGCVGDKWRCPCCGQVMDVEDLEELSVLDYLNDVYNLEYIVDSSRKYESCRIMVACGGPNIYIDTDARAVRLYWWGEYAEYPISSTAVDAVDDWGAEMWGWC